MKAIVVIDFENICQEYRRDYSLVSVDAICTIYQILERCGVGCLRVFFDEDMCIDMKAGFLKKFEEIAVKHQFDKLVEYSLLRIEAEINGLLQKENSNGYVFTGYQCDFLKHHEGMLFLSNYNYDKANKIRVESGHGLDLLTPHATGHFCEVKRDVYEYKGHVFGNS